MDKKKTLNLSHLTTNQHVNSEMHIKDFLEKTKLTETIAKETENYIAPEKEVKKDVKKEVKQITTIKQQKKEPSENNNSTTLIRISTDSEIKLKTILHNEYISTGKKQYMSDLIERLIQNYEDK